ncbi:MAG: alcohol dehydrogenase catalytic domain-containing protein [Acidobacteriota bacterium]|nr:alcohol dehydrogenase catalytic domain-containing protein [Acidobacteriota bacterium]
MRALVYTAPRQLVMEDWPRPVPAEGEIEIAVAAAGICGSDMSGFLGHSRRRIPPMVMGHELVGRTTDGRRVVANPLINCGRCTACLSGAQNLCSGWRLLGMDRTAGCYAEFVALPATQVYEIPEDMSDERAVMTEPLANIVHLFRIAAPLPFFRMGIVGGGTMGSLALLTALRLGVREVLVQDVSDVRLAVSRRMGATLAANVSTEEGREEARRFAGHGLDLVLDASGTAAARQAAFDLCRPGGLVVLLGMSNERSEIDFVTSIRKEHRVAMSFAYTPVDFERSLALLRAGEIDLTPWTREMPLEEGQQAFDRMTMAPGDTLKMLLRVTG